MGTIAETLLAIMIIAVIVIGVLINGNWLLQLVCAVWLGHLLHQYITARYLNIVSGWNND